jgi:2,5-diamino-6-(ribosylamino)-4(3H)-pyrimidinone 5'-phosphate reductase
MIATVDGRAAVGGTAAGIGSDLDRRLMRELRAEADVVLHGASTVRADPLSARVPPDLIEERVARGQTPQPLGAIITASGNLPTNHPYFESSTVVYVTSSRPLSVSGPTIELRRVSSIKEVIEDLKRRGVRRILCEGGPTLNVALFEAGLVDEIFFTLAPRIAGGDNPLTIVHGGAFGSIPLELVSLERHGSELFLRYRVLYSTA